MHRPTRKKTNKRAAVPSVKRFNSLDDVDLFDVGVADVSAVEDVGFPVEGTPERVAEPAGADFGHAGCKI